MLTANTNRIPSSKTNATLYGRVWRWHFFAGLLCLPVLLSLAITGGLYLFKNEINNWIYKDQRFVKVSSESRLSLQELTTHALKEVPGKLKQLQMPASPERSLQVTVVNPFEGPILVSVDPYTGKILGSQKENRQWDMIVKQLHSLTLVGTWANWLVEIVAGWTLVLGITGIYLWWPRGKNSNLISVRGSPRYRLWWRDAHALAGVIGGGIILFLALTGMPWSAVWGQQFNKFVGQMGLGAPPFIWGAPQSTLPLSSQGDAPWALENTPLPESEHQPEKTPLPISLGEVDKIFISAGVRPGYVLRMPWGPTGVYSALQFPADVNLERVVHVDQYSGKVIADSSYPQYGAVAKVTAWGISVHQGKQYGWLNQLIMLIGCVALVLLVMSAVIMWLKRRPAGRLAAPPRQHDHKLSRNVLVIAVLLGLIFPLLGASMVIIILIDSILIDHCRQDNVG